jgi:hypothetical protein
MSETAAECLRIELSVFASATRRGNRYHVGGSADMDLWKGPGTDTILMLVCQVSPADLQIAHVKLTVVKRPVVIYL